MCLNFRTFSTERTLSSDSEGRSLPEISKTKARNLKALIKGKLEERREARKLVSPDPPPRYDEVFAKGQEWLDGLAGSPVEPMCGRLHFSDNDWKSLSPGEPEIP